MSKANTVPLGTKSVGASLRTDLTLIEVADAELMHELRAGRGGDLGGWFVPHLSLAYASGDADDAGARVVVAAHAHDRPAWEVGEVLLVALRIEHRVYVWDELARVPLGG